DRADRTDTEPDSSADGMAIRDELRALSGSRHSARSGGREFCRRVADCERLVSARVSGPRHGNRRSGELGNVAGDSICATPCTGAWMAQRVWHRDDSYLCGLAAFLPAGEGRAWEKNGETLGRLRVPAEGSGYGV